GALTYPATSGLSEPPSVRTPGTSALGGGPRPVRSRTRVDPRTRRDQFRQGRLHVIRTEVEHPDAVTPMTETDLRPHATQGLDIDPGARGNIRKLADVPARLQGEHQDVRVSDLHAIVAACAAFEDGHQPPLDVRGGHADIEGDALFEPIRQHQFGGHRSCTS